MVNLSTDVHCCGDCMIQFNNLNDFFIHKLEIEKCTLTLEDFVLLPGLKVPVFSKVDPNSSNNIHFIETCETDPPVEEVEVYDMGEISEEEMLVDSPTEALKIDEHLPSPQVTTNETEKVTNEVKENENKTDKEVSELDREGSEVDKIGSSLKCSLCGHKYKNKTILKVHKRTVHNVDNPYSCNLCSMAFKTKGSLTRHLRRHSDERPYKCSTCEKGFRDSGSLTRHLKSLLHCNSFNKTLSKESKEAMKAQKTKAANIPRPTSVNVLITRLKPVAGDKESVGDSKVIATVVNKVGNKLERKVVEIKLNKSDSETVERKLIISESNSELENVS